MSKSYGLSGLRLGWIAGPHDLINACWGWKVYTSISNSPINDYLANNLEVFINWLEEHKDYFDYVKPKAGVLLFPRIKNILVSTEELCKGLYEKHKLLMVPGECFEMPGFLRIGFGNDSDMFKTGLSIFSAYLKEQS